MNILNTKMFYSKFLYKPKNNTLYIILYYINIILYNSMYHMYFYGICKMIQYNFKSNACF